MKALGLGRRPDLLALGLAVATCGVGLHWSTRVAGGSDSYGYVSQALLWSAGQAGPQAPAIADAPWKEATATLAPLGYRPSADGRGVVPQYPPGLPLLFAAAHRVGGLTALYAVVPLLGGLAVWLTYLLSRSRLSSGLALLPPLLVVASPAFLHQLFQPMSDVPVTAAWLAAIACARRSSRMGSVVTGALASMAVLIRPNLAPLAIVLAAWCASSGKRSRTLALLLLGAFPGLALLATVNSAWYGSPLRFGYGSSDSLFGSDHILPNLHHYAGWWTTQQTPFLSLALAAPFLARGEATREARRWRAFAALFALAVLAAYLPYLEFGDWTYLRFFLPAIPLLSILAVSVTAVLLGTTAVGRAVTVATVVSVALFGGCSVVDNGSFRLAAAETRYPVVAAEVTRRCEANAVFVTLQHSGSLRFYADRTTVRWDVMPPHGLDRAVAWLEASGRPVYFLLEDWEVDGIRERFPRSLYAEQQGEPLGTWGGARLSRPSVFRAPSRRRPTSRPRSAARRPARPD